MKTMCEKLKELIIEQSDEFGSVPSELEEMVDHLGNYNLITDAEYTDLEALIAQIDENYQQKRRIRMEQIQTELNEIKEEQNKLNKKQRQLEKERGY